MKQIDKIIKSQSEPQDTNVLWLDTRDVESPTLRAYESGEWKKTVGEIDLPITTSITSSSTNDEIPGAKAVYDLIRELESRFDALLDTLEGGE